MKPEALPDVIASQHTPMMHGRKARAGIGF